MIKSRTNTPIVSPNKYVAAVSKCNDGSIFGDKINELPNELIIEAMKPINKIERQCMIFVFRTETSNPIQPIKVKASGAQNVPTRTKPKLERVISPSQNMG